MSFFQGAAGKKGPFSFLSIPSLSSKSSYSFSSNASVSSSSSANFQHFGPETTSSTSSPAEKLPPSSSSPEYTHPQSSSHRPLSLSTLPHLSSSLSSDNWQKDNTEEDVINEEPSQEESEEQKQYDDDINNNDQQDTTPEHSPSTDFSRRSTLPDDMAAFLKPRDNESSTQKEDQQECREAQVEHNQETNAASEEWNEAMGGEGVMLSLICSNNLITCYRSQDERCA